jgi:SAM-dependent methyltransferase
VRIKVPLIPEGKVKDFLRDVRRSVIKTFRFPRVKQSKLGYLDRVTPVSSNWGLDRGMPVDRIFIENFISAHSSDIRGRVLEVANNDYTLKFGGDRVARSDILHDTPGNARATLVLDLANAGEAPLEKFDCIICTQTLHLIYDFHAAIESLHKMLKTYGVLLLTVPGISAAPRRGMGGYTDYWRFTSNSVNNLFETWFGEGYFDVTAFGNVYAATAFLHGLAVEELDPNKLSYVDSDYEMLIALRAVKRP